MNAIKGIALGVLLGGAMWWGVATVVWWLCAVI